jgi:NADH dehydrogenase
MIGLDRQRREVQVAAHVDDEGRQVTPMRSFRYDTLVIAVGSESNDFGTPGVREHAVALDTSLQATRFHRRLVNAYIRGHAQPDALRPEQLQVAIIGAGATGTELAAELHYTTRQLVAYGLDRIDPEKDVKIHLIEAADRILPALPERLSIAALKLFESLNVHVHAASKVAEVGATGVKLVNGTFLPAELVVWAAGVKAPDFLRNLDGLETNRINQPVGSLMGGLLGGNLWIEGLFARLMYRSLYKLHEYALHGPTKVTLDTLGRLITRRTEPHVKLH